MPVEKRDRGLDHGDLDVPVENLKTALQQEQRAVRRQMHEVGVLGAVVGVVRDRAVHRREARRVHLARREIEHGDLAGSGSEGEHGRTRRLHQQVVADGAAHPLGPAVCLEHGDPPVGAVPQDRTAAIRMRDEAAVHRISRAARRHAEVATLESGDVEVHEFARLRRLQHERLTRRRKEERPLDALERRDRLELRIEQRAVRRHVPAWRDGEVVVTGADFPLARDGASGNDASITRPQRLIHMRPRRRPTAAREDQRGTQPPT